MIAVMLVTVLVPAVAGWGKQPGNERQSLLRLWDEGDYEKVFTVSKAGLEAKPLDYFLLTIHGYSAFHLGIAQINNFDKLTYIDQCIWSLRKALLAKNNGNNGQVYYFLGKAYYHKGDGFADLAVKYLEEARAASYVARDISEYLGLVYAAVHDYRNSVAAFTLALDPAGDGDEASDRLLLAIAHSYLSLEEQDMAKAYLLRCIETSRDSRAIVAARLLLGGVLAAGGNSEEAEAQYMIVLKETGENAEARYQLGKLYAARDKIPEARAEWRRAIRIDPAHKEARLSLNNM
ncbi:hypothetical protein AGMMS50268_40640 [Spirochaetia bacterium]|nr:hypothetical protein AGMMS50268_40640 [Spirochaetia bacterium]